ncbi:hypothetical protein ACOME3_004769, partial [Neoechinorhynchus agilis]
MPDYDVGFVLTPCVWISITCNMATYDSHARYDNSRNNDRDYAILKNLKKLTNTVIFKADKGRATVAVDQ